MTELWKELRRAAMLAPGSLDAQSTWIAVADRGRALLAKPVATREGLAEYINKTKAGWILGGDTLDALLDIVNHFAAPDRLKTMADGMTVRDWEVALLYADGVPNARADSRYIVVSDAARVAHRLANTPAPVVDEDAEAKRLAWKHYIAAIPDHSARIHKTPTARWESMHITDRVGWRAVAKEKAGE
jgi:hypothetical protein